MKISIVIPNYNGSNLLQKNIPAVLKSIEQYKDAEIIVVDDASLDNSLKTLDSFGSKITIVRNNHNMGFGSAVNKGVDRAKGDVIVLLNTDVRPQEDFLEPALKHFDNQKVFAVGFLDESIENGEKVERGRGIGKWEKGFLAHNAGDVSKENTLWANGGSSVFRKAMWDQLQGMSTLYKPFYWEDIDISYRAWKAGYEIVFEKESRVVHEHEEGAIKKNFSSLYVKTIAYKNQFIFVWKNITDIDLIISHIVWLPYHFLIAIKNMDWAFYMGFLRALFLAPQIIQSNISNGNNYTKTDKEVLSLFGS